MKYKTYSRWDGTLEEFKLDADRALDAVSDYMMHGLSAQEAVEVMRYYGFRLAGMDFRVMGLRELIQRLRREMRKLYQHYHMREALDGIRERFEKLLNQEQQTLDEMFGYESSAMNEFLERRYTPAQKLSEAIDGFRDYRFHNREAAAAFEKLVQELERLKALERFLEQQARHFRGRTAADYETAQRIREQLQTLQEMLNDLQQGDFQKISPEDLGRLLGEDASRSFILIQDLESSLRERGYLRDRDGMVELTPAAIRRIGATALASVYARMRKGRPGRHQTTASGVSLPRPDETKTFEFGDPLNIDVVKTLVGSMRRTALNNPGRRIELPIELAIDDLQIRQMDFTTRTTTVLLLDLSWSMSWEGRFPAAKRVALAMDQLIRTRFPRDHFFIVGFSTRARQLSPGDLPEISWNPGDPFTNLQEGLMVAERLIAEHPNPNPQVIVITDGQPTAYFIDNELHVEWPMGYGSISPRAVAQTLKQVERVTRRGITINTFMLHDSPELVGFVERMTEINRGRAVFTDPAHLGSYVLVDHLSRHHRTRRGS